MSTDEPAPSAPDPTRKRPTREQAAALAVRGASVALGAGAGCGKTSVLTSRFLEALEGDDRQPLSALAAVTFTEKAACELRQRIRRECHDRLEAAGAEETGHWRTVLRGLEAAPVSTFHEYAAGRLRRHALVAGVDPDFEILDATLAASVRDDALDRCLRRWLAEENDDLITLAVEFGLAHVREAIGDLVSRRDAADLDAWVGRTPAEVFEIWKHIREERGRPFERARFLTAVAKSTLWFQAFVAEHAKLTAFRNTLLDALGESEASCDDLGWLAKLRALATLPRGLRKEAWPSPEINEAAKASLNALREAIDRWVNSQTCDESASLEAAAHGLRYARLAALVRAEFDAAKVRRGGLDFDDLLLKTRDLLRAGASGGAQGQIPVPAFLLVDEFQDTDPVQADILRLIAGDGFGTGRLFLVGDFKQSIYRFRGARPELFQKFRAEFPPEGRLELTENFRSTTGVLAFVNALFVEAFAGEKPRLIAGPQSQPPSDAPAVEFVWADERGDDDEATNAHARRAEEARWLARLLRERIDAGWPVRDRKSGRVRDAHAGDVAFLFRAMTDVAPYENALKREGLDFHVVGGSAFFAQQEIQDLVNVLSVVEDPFDSVALAGALRSPFFGLSDDALFWLGGFFGDLATRFLREEGIASLSTDDRRRADRARASLDRWAGMKDRMPISGLVDRVLDESGYEAALPGEFLGDRKRANARKLVRLARRFDARGGFTLGDFVARLRADLRDPPREEQAATTDEEGTSVRLMSVHQAKGLEFPVVVVPDLNRKGNPPRRGVTFDPEFGPLVRPDKESPADADAGASGQSLGWTLFTTLERDEDEAEALRLFYVATTRARDHLILSAGGAADVKPASPALRLLDARFDRSSGAVVSPLPEGWSDPVVRVIATPPEAGTAPTSTRRPPLRALARLIDETPVRFPPPASLLEKHQRLPRLIDLAEIRGLSARDGRLDRLVRAILDDPAAIKPGALVDVANRATRRQTPRASDALTSEAVGLLEPWLAGLLGRRLASAKSVVRNYAWTVPWPADAREPTIVRGHAELVIRDEAGFWGVVVISPARAPGPVECLRWALSTHALLAQNAGPVGHGWMIRLGLGEEATLFDEKPFDPRDLDAAFRAVLDGL